MHPSRRRFLQTAGLVTGSLALAPRLLPAVVEPAGSSSLTVADLPAGAAPRPVALPHFPSPLHALVWRNWSLVPLDRLAQVIGATPTQIRRLGRAMGLSGPPRISRDVQRRSALTVIRRNWHLLPYDQLLALLDWTPAQLAFALREDDFLFIKLGSLKPECDPIRYRLRRPANTATSPSSSAATWHLPARAGNPLPLRGQALLRAILRCCPLPQTLRTALLLLCFALCGDPLLDRGRIPTPTVTWPASRRRASRGSGSRRSCTNWRRSPGTPPGALAPRNAAPACVASSNEPASKASGSGST
ncbi:MAG: twin-arginine translocation signal domain-containing protein [Verrucomicrobiales bacterium]|nr:twin-arginine translocation signal domain-containing protein [Verrucomicrobiales bacterium]